MAVLAPARQNALHAAIFPDFDMWLLRSAADRAAVDTEDIIPAPPIPGAAQLLRRVFKQHGIAVRHIRREPSCDGAAVQQALGMEVVGKGFFREKTADDVF